MAYVVKIVETDRYIRDCKLQKGMSCFSATTLDMNEAKRFESVDEVNQYINFLANGFRIKINPLKVKLID